ncbi:hypothetical protein GCM10009801_75110 [Streptomyces albiaxialis]|uniref:DUF3291 domain-containing protein n=1 Tax=Streptomyces albiaxialis TaxID=329523 RepID=A0ABN2WYT1_9ACTN
MPSPAVRFAAWKPGPAAAHDGPGPLVVSLTEFAPHRPWHAVGVTRAGLALRRAWPDVEGAIGLWLWTVPGLLRPRTGSVSLWHDEEDLRRFVARPDHRRIMRAYRDRGTLRATTWHTPRSDAPAGFDKSATLHKARALITRWPDPAPLG